MKIGTRSHRFFLLHLFLLLSLPSLILSKGKTPPEKSGKEAPVEAKEPEAKQEQMPAKAAEPPAEEMKASTAPAQEETQKAVEAPAPEEKPAPKAKVKRLPRIPPGGKVHTVWVWQESKDCLWQLAKDYYGDPWQWKKIYLANQNTILNPKVIYPKQKIVIPPVDN